MAQDDNKLGVILQLLTLFQSTIFASSSALGKDIKYYRAAKPLAPLPNQKTTPIENYSRPSHPVTSNTSPIKYKPAIVFAAMVLEEMASQSTPPNVTSAVR